MTPSSDVVVVAFLAGPFLFRNNMSLFKKDVFWMFWVKKYVNKPTC